MRYGLFLIIGSDTIKAAVFDRQEHHGCYYAQQPLTLAQGILNEVTSLFGPVQVFEHRLPQPPSHV
jgi:hypothetical protein